MSKAAQLAALIGSGQAQGNKNLIINGAMAVAQRSSSAVTVNSTTRTYAIDRFFGFGTSSAGVFTEEQSTDVPSGERFYNSSKITVTTNSSPSGSQTYGWGQGIEGLNTASLMFGSANAMTVTLSFWVKSSLTGTFSVILANNGGSRTYPATYTISSANTWEYKSITVAGDQSGTWNTDNTEGLSVLWMLGTGSSLHGTANAWAASKFGVSGQTDLIGTNGATLYITGVSLEVGDVATPFEHESYAETLQKCQRYHTRIEKASGQTYSSTAAVFCGVFPTEMRTSPTGSLSGALTIGQLGIAGSKTQSSSNIALSASTNSASVFNAECSNFSSLTTHQAAAVAGGTQPIIFDSEL